MTRIGCARQPSLDPGQFGVAAHEYAHVVLHANGAHFPDWLNEGLAEFFSTVRISNRQCEMGGDIRSHSEVLRNRTWLPLARFLELRLDSLGNRAESSMFYAQSWAFAHMLLLSPEYRPRFPELIAALTSGEASAPAIWRVYTKSLESITGDMHAFLSHYKGKSITAPGVNVRTIETTSSELTPFASRSLLAELLLESGQLDRAEALYGDLGKESPQNADISAALGTIALRKGDVLRARLKWKQAIAEGMTDANLCYRYAAIAEEAGIAPSEIRPALERALALKTRVRRRSFQARSP